MRTLRQTAMLIMTVATIWGYDARVFASGYTDLASHIANNCDDGQINNTSFPDIGWSAECFCNDVPSSCYDYASNDFCGEFLSACDEYCTTYYCPMDAQHSYCNVGPYGASGTCKCKPIDLISGCDYPSS